ncbi:MAG: hypothetical protein ACJ74W_02985 [Pyrinomonadaceae bacterium]
MNWLDKILENTRDPSWWFTALFIAIIASLLAAYIKELLGKLFSRLSPRFKFWWQKRRFRRAVTIIVTACDTNRILFLISRVLGFSSVVIFYFLSFLCLAILRDIRQDYSTTLKILMFSAVIFVSVFTYLTCKETFKLFWVYRVNLYLNQNTSRIARMKLSERRANRKQRQ